jgi:hypothetical protein
MRRRLALLAALVGMMALGGGTLTAWHASANTVEVHFTTVDETRLITDICAFDVQEHAVGTFKVIDFFDDSGNIIKSILTNFGGPYTLTVSANGVTLTSQTVTTVIIVTFNPDGSLNTISVTGLNQNFVLPGGGTVFLDAGRIVLDSNGNIIFEAGPHPGFHGDFDSLCAALSGS